MPTIEEFVSWVKTKGGQKGLAAAFAKKFPKEKPISQTAVSNWVTRRGIPIERRPQLELLGWKGPWEWPEEALAPAGDFTPREDYWKLVGRVEALERLVQNLSEGYQAHIVKEPGKAHPQETQR